MARTKGDAPPTASLPMMRKADYLALAGLPDLPPDQRLPDCEHQPRHLFVVDDPSPADPGDPTPIRRGRVAVLARCDPAPLGDRLVGRDYIANPVRFVGGRQIMAGDR